MNVTDFRFGFRVLGDCRQPRRLVDAGAALAAYAACDPRCELGQESYLSAFQFAADFREHLNATGSTAGFSGPCWATWLWWDIDAPDDELERAREAARRLVVAVTDRLRVAEDDVLVFFSGAKGFHIGAPTAPWTPAPGHDFHKVARRFAEAVAEQAGAVIDTGVYDRVRCFRAPNSRHPKTGLHKRRLTVDELMHLSTSAILKLAEKPEPFELPTPTYTSESAAALWAEAVEHVRLKADARAERLANGTPEQLNRTTLDFIRDGAAKGDRHRLSYSAAANLAELGAPLPLCVALLTEAALDTGLPPSDVRRAVENGWASVQPGVKDVCQMFNGEVIQVKPAPTAALSTIDTPRLRAWGIHLMTPNPEGNMRDVWTAFRRTVKPCTRSSP